MYSLLLKNSTRLEQLRVASSPVRFRPFQHITVCHLNGESPLRASAAGVKNTTLQERPDNGINLSSAPLMSVAPLTNPLPTSTTIKTSQSSQKPQPAISELITVLGQVENFRHRYRANSGSLSSRVIRLRRADLSKDLDLENLKEPPLLIAPPNEPVSATSFSADAFASSSKPSQLLSSAFSPLPPLTVVNISSSSSSSSRISSTANQITPNDATSIEHSQSKFSNRIDSSTLEQNASLQRPNLPNSRISPEPTGAVSVSAASETRAKEETSEMHRRQMVANAKFEDVAESLIVDLLRAVSRRKTLSEEVRSLCLAALRTLVIAHPKSIYLHPILEEKRAQHHAAAREKEELAAKQKRRKAAPESPDKNTKSTAGAPEGDSKVPETMPKSAPFPKELKYPLPFTVVEYISKVDNFNRQFLCYIDVCYGANMPERVDQLLERYEHSNRSIEGITNGYLIYDLNIYASIARHYAKTINIEGIQKLFNLMSNANLSPDYEFVAYFFEAFARFAKDRLPPTKSANTSVDFAAADTKSLKSILADTPFPRLLDQIRRANLVAPGNIRERFNPAVVAQRCRYRTDEQLALMKSLLDVYFPPAPNSHKSSGDPKASLKAYSSNTLFTHFIPSATTIAPSVSFPTGSHSCRLSPPAPFSRNPFAGVLPASREDRERLLSEQFNIEEATRLELNSFEVSFYERKASLTTAQKETILKRTLDSLKVKWRASLLEEFNNMVSNIENSPLSKYKNAGMMTFGRLLEYNKDMISFSSFYLLPFFKLLPPEDFVDILLKELDKLCSNNANYSPKLSIIRANIARAVMSKHLSNRVQHETPEFSSRLKDAYRLYLDKFNSGKLEGGLLRVAWIDSLHAVSINNIEHPLRRTQEPWTWEFEVSFGRHLLDLLMNITKFDATSYPFSSSLLDSDDHEDRSLWQSAGFDPKKTPALRLVSRQKGDDFTIEIKTHGKISQLQDAVNERSISFAATELPTLLPPVPWVSPNIGGYALQSQSLVRLPEETRRAQTAVSECLRQTPHDRMHAVMDAISCVSSCPWRVNHNVMDVAGKIFADGGNKALALPHSEAHFKSLVNEAYKSLGRKQREERLREIVKEKREAFSLWSTERYRFTIAQQYKDKVFFLPHTLDFRGRCYPTPPHFQHMGGDLSRGMLQFAQAKPLGERGLFWLKVHLANLYGQAKKSALSEKIKWADANLENIKKSVENTNAPEAWWKKADEPFQALSVCFEILSAINSPDPSAYCSRQPIHQDGSCNVLQHYAAMGRDQKGAEAVNLCPLNTPQDVYSDVVKLVEEMRKKDEAAGMPIARLLQGCITRKLIKQTVMTTSYGVTQYGAREQIGRQLKDANCVPKERIFEARDYLQSKVFEALDNMFIVSKHIKQWFSDNAYNISTLRQQPVRWTTPLGFTVVQPYFQKPPKGKRSYSIFDPPKASKQKTAFPPNFVHSLDAVHMMLTALHCNRAGITFAAVHDCFWTHPCDVDLMNRICREQFIALHQLPILKNLSAEFKTRYGFESHEISRVSRPHVERFHEALEQLPPSTVFASDSAAAGEEKITALNAGCEENSVDEVLGGSFDEIRALPFWNDSTDSEERHQQLLGLNELLDQVPPQGSFDIKNVLESTYFFA